MSILRGGAGLALPLLLGWSLARPAFALDAGSLTMGMIEQAPADMPAQIDVTAMYLMGRPEALDDVAKAFNFPATGSQMALYGGGGSVGKGALRVGVQALVGGLSNRQGGLNTEWRLHLGNLLLEQRYPLGPIEATAGGIFSYALTEGLLEDGVKITRFDAQSYGYGFVAGARWPRATQLGFLVRGGYLWLPVSGTWKGDLVGLGFSPKATFDLGGPIAQAQIELGF